MPLGHPNFFPAIPVVIPLCLFAHATALFSSARLTACTGYLEPGLLRPVVLAPKGFPHLLEVTLPRPVSHALSPYDYITTWHDMYYYFSITAVRRCEGVCSFATVAVLGCHTSLSARLSPSRTVPPLIRPLVVPQPPCYVSPLNVFLPRAWIIRRSGRSCLLDALSSPHSASSGLRRRLHRLTISDRWYIYTSYFPVPVLCICVASVVG
ncbi:hypothetical protein BD309DRAFT_556417 [Dichomitus squalens]|uniref:Uncharacterized protein n=1 Tax=Dichomitus squalens TaxID=114155 RepID=A0A4Q9NB00_9APHY|nr:hypothetical protein BD309DRAFT_556417 [Dichomitus squalens]TBU55891.1 hypothetical protein BD310DRAFT_651915 [Dichomitus squalens]